MSQLFVSSHRGGRKHFTRKHTKKREIERENRGGLLLDVLLFYIVPDPNNDWLCCTLRVRTLRQTEQSQLMDETQSPTQVFSLSRINYFESNSV